VAGSKRLGRGLESLLSQGALDGALPEAPASAESVPLDQIRPNRFQPRDDIGPQELSELAASIREHGVLQPVVVRPAAEGVGYELIAGERRWRAAREAGIDAIPVVVRDISDDDALTLALVENLQREDLNPVEKARAFRDMSEKFGLTQEEIAKRAGKDRSTIANFMRLLDLPDGILELVSRGTIAMGHARALLAVKLPQHQMQLCERIVREELSVREVERRVASLDVHKSKKKKALGAKLDAHLRDLEDRMRERLGLKVSLDARGHRGKVTIHYQSDDELQRLLEVLGI